MRGVVLKIVPLIFTMTLMACTTAKQPSYVNAAVVPLNDLNLVRPEIPEILTEAAKQPYKVPDDLNCETLNTVIHELNKALGSDYDALKLAERDLIDQGLDEAGSRAVGALRRTTEGVVPFRSWVRKLTGAERYAKRISSTAAAGVTRRAFLKGLRISMNCPMTIPTRPFGQLAMYQ